MRLIVVMTVVDIAVLVGVLAFYLFWVSSLLRSIADGLGEVNEMVGDVIGHASTIVPDLQHANRTLGSISGALPLLYGLAEKIVAKKTARPAASSGRAGAAR
jgi:hypothetical protein